MKKRFLLITSILVLAIMLGVMFMSCNSSTVIEGKDYEKMEEYYNEALTKLQKHENQLNELMDVFGKANFTTSFTYERTYYSTADDFKTFRGTETTGGYKHNDKDENGNKIKMWMYQAVDYTINYNNGDYYIVAKVAKPVSTDEKNYQKIRNDVEEYKLLKIGNNESVNSDNAIKYCRQEILGIIEKMSKKDYIEDRVVAVDNGFRLYTSMMQYKLVSAHPYDADGNIKEDVTLKYSDNKDKEFYQKTTLPLTNDNVAYWDNYGEDISYNLEKTAEIVNERVTITYSKGKSQIKSYQYNIERVLPFYDTKSDFDETLVLKAVVADYSTFVMELDYKTGATIPDSI